MARQRSTVNGLRRGTKVGPYSILRLRAVGGMADLYDAEVRGNHRGPGMPRRVVLKVAHEEREVFLKDEADFLRRFDHSGLVRIYPLPGHGKPMYVAFHDSPGGRRPYIALETVGGGTLEELLVRRRRLTVHESVHIAAQLARALEHAHGQGVISRDVKPGNILFRPPGWLGDNAPKAVLCDFGIALDRSRPQAGESQAGTFGYMSPEQVRRLSDPRVPIGPSSDVYSLGAVLYEMLSGGTPFGEDIRLIADANLPATPPSASRQGLPPALEQIVMRALQKNPLARYETAGEMAEALERLPYRLNVRLAVKRTVLLAMLVLAVGLAWLAGIRLRQVLTPTPTPQAAPAATAALQPEATAVVPEFATAPPSPVPAILPTTTTLRAPPTATRPPTSTPITPTATFTPAPTRPPRPTAVPTSLTAAPTKAVPVQ